MMLATIQTGGTLAMTVRGHTAGIALAAMLLWLLAADASGATAQVEGYIILQTSPLAGFQYHAGRAVFPLLRVGDQLSLRREPDNPHDPRAIRVDWRGVPLGYVPRLDNLDLARLMDRGMVAAARILHLEKSRDPWKRVLLEIYMLEEGAGQVK